MLRSLDKFQNQHPVSIPPLPITLVQFLDLLILSSQCRKSGRASIENRLVTASGNISPSSRPLHRFNWSLHFLNRHFLPAATTTPTLSVMEIRTKTPTSSRSPLHSTVVTEALAVQSPSSPAIQSRGLSTPVSMLGHGFPLDSRLASHRRPATRTHVSLNFAILLDAVQRAKANRTF
jgi:hypothetical protein